MAAAVAATICALCAVLAATSVATRQGALDRAATEAGQLVDVQEARTAAVEADALAASSFLVGGQQAAAQRPAYESRLADATQQLAAVAAQASPADLERLGPANGVLASYAGLVEQARANNRQGFPVGAAYQRQASALLRTDYLPALDDVLASTRDRLNDDLDDASWASVLVVAALVIGVVALVAASWLLGRRTRRIVNVPMAIGTVLSVVALVWAAYALATTGSDVRGSVDTSLRAVDAVSRARTSAFDARSAESLTLINRGNGAANEADWQLADARVVAALDTACDAAGVCLQDTWSAYGADHRGVRSLDDGGNYDGAVEQATAIGASGSAFVTFGDDAAQAQQSEAAAVASAFADGRSALDLLRWFVLVAGLAAAGTVVVGFGQRLREYR
ncbi:MAG: hypothetical protein ABW195_01020 [Ilumatobacteraceae bacterium]